MRHVDHGSSALEPKKRFFYGWYLPAAALVMTLCYGVFLIYGFGVLLPSIIEETGWSRAQASGVYGILTAEVGLLGPIYGAIVSRFGSRLPMVAGSILGALGLILMGESTTLLSFYASFSLAAAGFGVYYFGPTAAITNWFKKNRGLCIGIVLAGTSLSGVLLPILQWSVDTHGWRHTLFLGGLISAGVCIPLSSLFRFRPEDYGYSVDGLDNPDSVETNFSSSVRTDVSSLPTFRPVNLLRNKNFWLLVAYYAIVNTSVTALLPHIVVYFKDVGIAEAITASAFGVYALVSIVSRIGGGAIGDRFNKQLTLAIATLVLAFGVLGTAYITEVWHMAFFTLFVAAGYSVTLSVVPTIISEIYGTKAFAVVFSWVMLPGMIISLGGPVLVGFIADINGGYRESFIGLFIIIFLAAPIIMKVASPENSAD